MRVVVHGAGAIGAGIGGRLAGVGVEVCLVARGEHGRVMRERGLCLRTPDRDVTLRIPCVEGLAEVDWRDDDVVLVAVKLNDARAAYAELAAVAGTERPVVMGQNGTLGSEWARQAGHQQVIDSMVWVPAERLVPGTVDLHGAPLPGAIDLASDPGLAAPLREAGFRCTVRDDLARWQRAKWVTNLCGAAFVFDRTEWIPELQEEGHRVLAAAGFDVASAEELEAYVGDIGLAPIHGRERLPGGSTAQTAQRRQPLETRWLTGPLVELADRVGVPVPRNRALLALAT